MTFNSLIQDLILSETELAYAKARNEALTRKATELFIASNFDKVEVDGIQVELVERKRSTKLTSELLCQLQSDLEQRLTTNVESNLEMIYALQRAAFFAELEIHSLVEDNIVEDLRKHIKKEACSLEEETSSYYTLKTKLLKPSKVKNALTDILNELYIDAFKQKEVRGKAISKVAVRNFLKSYKNDSREDILRAWEEYKIASLPK